MTFEELGLSADLLRGIKERGYGTPTPIQEKAIPLILSRRDLLAAAQTGTGKTAAFGLPILQLLASAGSAESRQVRSLVLTPTRELAIQVHESLRGYARHLSLREAAVFGGVRTGPQIKALAGGVDVLVATPGRLLDLHQQGAVDFASLEVLVLDEADRMLDMGFIHDIQRIVHLLPKNRQTLMFSATFSREIRALASSYLSKPESVQVAPANVATELVKQTVYPVDPGAKADLLIHLINVGEWPRVLVFTRTREGADRLCKKLLRAGIDAVPIHGSKSQDERQAALEDFKAGHIHALVATDIAARGLDIDQLSEVVNFELPRIPEDYVHRVGRAGRAGLKGRSHSLVSAQEADSLRAIERVIGRSIPKTCIEGFGAATALAGLNTVAPSASGARPPRGSEPPGKRRVGAARAGGTKDPAGSPKPRRRRLRPAGAVGGLQRGSGSPRGSRPFKG